MSKSTVSAEEVKLLFDERKQGRERLARVDGYIFQFISVFVAPYTVLVGYCILNYEDRVRYALLLVPVIFIFGVLIMGLLYMHHFVLNVYLMYLAQSLNRVMSVKLLLEEMDAEFFARGFNIQKLFVILSFGFSTFIVFFLLPVYSNLLGQMANSEYFMYEISESALRYSYYSIIVLLSLLVTISLYYQFDRKMRKVRSIVRRNLLSWHEV